MLLMLSTWDYPSNATHVRVIGTLQRIPLLPEATRIAFVFTMLGRHVTVTF